MPKPKRRNPSDFDDSVAFMKRTESLDGTPHIAGTLGAGEVRHLMPWAQRAALGLRRGQLSPKEAMNQ